MNRGCKVLIFKVIFSQHILNKSLTKREINERRSLMSQRTFWLVEILLRVYIAYYHYSYIHIQQFNKKIMDLQRFKLLPRDGIEASHSPYRLIPTLPIAVEQVGGISQSVWRRSQFPTFLQHFSDLVFLHLYL